MNSENSNSYAIIFPKAKKCIIYLESAEINELSILAKLIIMTLGNKDDLKIVNNISKLNSLVIKDEIEYLLKYEILKIGKDGNYKLSNLGKEKYKILNQLENFNASKNYAAVDMSLGHILEENYLEPKDSGILNQEIINEILHNSNIFNIKEFLCNNFNNFKLEDFENEVYTIYLKPIEGYYKLRIHIKLPRNIDFKPLGFNLLGEEFLKIDDNYEGMKSSIFSLINNFVIFNFQLSNKRLNSISNKIIESLAEILKANPIYLSKESHKILELVGKQSIYNEKLSDYEIALNCADGDLAIINKEILVTDNQLKSETNSKSNFKVVESELSKDKWVGKIIDRYNQSNVSDLKKEVKLRIINNILESDISDNNWDIEIANIKKISTKIQVSSYYIKENGKYINE